ncbi:phytochrome and flowering time regulatory protein [Actinidia rufa]|uniref:Phytochrome and flowering time regulatory protein n=1 Tax=Actinidia rufa TaxID=165716 RepID=A0A7J0H653_9ERIC|nr:phytochrome and flowering time regulatory protein [Actinidia rufa]
MRRLVNLKLQRETTVAEHTSEFQSLVNQLTSVDLQFDDEMQALLLLSSLPESWETLVVSLSNLAPNGKLTTSMVMDALFNEEARRREMGSTDQSESQALVSEGSRERGRGQGRGHHRGTGKGQWRSQARDIAATVVMAVDESEEVLLAASDNGKSDWVLDSGSAYHLCRDREVFFTYAACEGRIWMANNTSSRVVGRGSVRFRMADGRSVTLTEVRHVPNLRKNLISIWMLDSKGCSFDASGGILRVFKENKEMLWGKKTGGLYRLEGSVQTGRATVRHGSSDISEKNGQGKIRSGTRAQEDALGYVRKSGQTRVMQPVQDVHREAQRKETKSILRSCTAKGAATPKRVSFALDLISGGVLSSCAHKGGRDGATTTRKVTYFVAHPGGGCRAPRCLLACSVAIVMTPVPETLTATCPDREHKPDRFLSQPFGAAAVVAASAEFVGVAAAFVEEFVVVVVASVKVFVVVVVVAAASGEVFVAAIVEVAAVVTVDATALAFAAAAVAADCVYVA